MRRPASRSCWPGVRYISRGWPWYPNVPWPALTCYVNERPRGVGEITDVQIEVVDGSGKAIRFRDAKITWKR
ncbi:MAG TPA: hypothetical protein VI670_19495 [Thermoanaerobaculia bacterium]|jgi:hypothetical protein